MRKVSVWAFQHPWTARLIIISLYIPINFLGIITGDLLYDFGIVFPGMFLLSLIAIVILLTFYYPSYKKTSENSNSYKKQKAFDLLLGICTFCMICFTGNQKNVQHPFSLTTEVISVPIPTAYVTEINSPVKEKTGIAKQKLTKKENKKKAKNFFKQLRKKYKDLSDGEKILLVFLTVVIALILLYLLAALACTIACAGSEALAYVVFFLGTGGIIYLAVHLIIKIVRKRQKTPYKDTVPTIPAS